MASMMDILVTNFYVLMVGQIEILKQNFKLLVDTELGSKISRTNDFPNETVANNKKVVSVKKEENFDTTYHSVSQITVPRYQKHMQAAKLAPDDKKEFEKSLQERLVRCVNHYDAIFR